MCLSVVVAAKAICLQGVTISNDGATIMKLLEIIHPAAKTLVDISLSQDAEVTYFCVAADSLCTTSLLMRCAVHWDDVCEQQFRSMCPLPSAIFHPFGHSRYACCKS